MIINVGDTIKANHGRTGEIINIGIATEATDIAAENDTAASVKTYDTELNYTGAVTFGEYWCYFIQIKDVIKRNEYQEDKSWIHQQQDSRHNQW